MTRYVALYTRISPKPNGKGLESCNDQEVWGRAYAAERWPGVPVKVYRDELISGADADREGFKELRHDLENDPPIAVWAVEQYRFTRDERLWFAFAAELVAAGLEEFHTNRDGIVRVEDEIAGIKAVIGAGMRRRMLRSQADTLARIAARGEPAGSRPFGYAHGTNEAGVRTYVIIPEQAEAIRYAADKVLAGWSLESIAEDLRKRDIAGGHRVKVTVTGKRWFKDGRNGELAIDTFAKPITRASTITASAVRDMVTNPTVAGLRVHKGKIVGPGNWEAILDEDTWKACKAKLEQPRRVKRSDGGEYPIGASHTGNPTGRKYLLTGGLTACGVCKAPLIGSLKQLRNATDRRNGTVRRKAYMLCTPRQGGHGCVGIMLDPLEQYVVEQMFAQLDRPEFLQAIAEDIHEQDRRRITAALEAINGPGGQREQLADLWSTAGELTVLEWKAARDGLAARERDLRTELAAIPPPMVNFDIAEVRAAWPDMELDERRTFLRTFVERVTIERARPGTQGFDPNRVKIAWRDWYALAS